MPRRYVYETTDQNRRIAYMTHSRTLVLLSLCTALTACSGNTVKDKLGLSRAAPDEFRVVAQPPLSVPPQFNLVAPGSEPAPAMVGADQKARTLITGNDDNTFSLRSDDNAPVKPAKGKAAKVTASSMTSSESAFLKKAGADKADPTVRNELVEEKVALQEKQEEGSWWNPFSGGSKDTMVDAKKEAERIQKAKDEGKPVTEGETPDVRQKDTGVIGRIFGY